LFYWLIQREGPVFTANVSLLIPVAGVLWGAALLGEPLTPVSLAGMVLVVAGLALVLRPSTVDQPTIMAK
jgi:drug/metabolite transporter (DMT)-like permease